MTFCADFSQYDYKEAIVRVFINALLKTVAVEAGIRIEQEMEAGETDEKRKIFPDYTIYNYDVPLGVVEVKRGKALIQRLCNTSYAAVNCSSREEQENDKSISIIWYFN